MSITKMEEGSSIPIDLRGEMSIPTWKMNQEGRRENQLRLQRRNIKNNEDNEYKAIQVKWTKAMEVNIDI